nr:flippase [Chitinophaga sp. SYP-B3965]
MWLFGDRIFKMLLGVIVGAWMARYLGPVSLGKLNYVMAYIAIIMSISTLGMDNFLVKELVMQPESKNEVLGTSLVMRIAIILISIAVPLGIFKYMGLASEYYLIYALLILTVVFTPLDLIDIYYQSILKSRITVVSKNVAYILGAAVKIILILNKMPLAYFAAVLGMETVFAMLFLFITYQRKENNNFRNWKFNKTLVPYLFKKAWPFMLASLVVILYMKVDQIMLGNMDGELELGQFSAAVKISEMFFFIPMAISSSFLPELIESHKSNTRGEYLQKMQFFFDIVFLTALLIIIVISFSSGFIVHLLYGSEFPKTSTILIIHVWSLIAVFMGVASSQYLIIEGLEQFAFYRTAIGLCVNIGLNYYFIPRFGSIGAAYATLISYYVATFFAVLAFKRTRPLFYYQVRSLLAPYSLAKKFKII